MHKPLSFVFAHSSGINSEDSKCFSAGISLTKQSSGIFGGRQSRLQCQLSCWGMKYLSSFCSVCQFPWPLRNRQCLNPRHHGRPLPPHTWYNRSILLSACPETRLVGFICQAVSFHWVCLEYQSTTLMNTVYYLVAVDISRTLHCHFRKFFFF